MKAVFSHSPQVYLYVQYKGLVCTAISNTLSAPSRLLRGQIINKFGYCHVAGGACISGGRCCPSLPSGWSLWHEHWHSGGATSSSVDGMQYFAALSSQLQPGAAMPHMYTDETQTHIESAT